MAKRPLIPTAPISEFGELPNDPAFFDPAVMDRDQSYVPGWSEMRRAHDLKVAEYRAHKCARSDIPTLPVNLRWARNQTKAGTPDSTKVFTHGRKGYRLVTKDDVKQEWLKELPPGSQVQADGTIRNGDCVLMVASREDAARNAVLKQRMTQERLTGLQDTFEQNLHAVGVTPRGTDPSATIIKDTTTTPASKPGHR